MFRTGGEMKKIRVLLVDDSAVIRKVLGDLIAADPELEVAGTAANGKLALEQLEILKPDIVTMDIEMPEMDGLQTVQEIRKRGSQIPIIMCSSLTAAGAAHTLDALAFGANDYVTKPSSHGVNTREVVGEELIRKIKGLASPNANLIRGVPPQAGSARQPDTHVRVSTTILEAGTSPGKNFGVVAIGVSTGGPNALQDLLPRLPANLQVPILLVQHMPPLFTKLLADRLGAQAKVPVVEAVEGQEVKAGTIYIAPGGLHMEVKRVFGRVIIALHEGPPENSCRPAVDVLFRSVAKVYGADSLGVILTGMGQDGLNGSKHIKQAGGAVIAQEREGCAVWGMPGAVVDAGLASGVLSLQDIASEIVKRGVSERDALASSEQRV
jgi:two-component system chemotaxis response regulator CheB